jgi:tetratricopeptide (TPR) repeat protein
MVCPSCHSVHPDGTRYCSSCGAYLEEPAPASTLREAWLHALALLHQGDLQKARRPLRDVLDLDPSHAVARTYLGLADLASGDLSEAIEDLARASADGLPLASLFLGIARRAAGDPSGAVAAFRRAAEAIPDLHYALHGEAGAGLDLDNLSAAASAYEKLAVLDPEDAVPHFWLGVIHKRRGRLEDAEAALERALGRNPELTEARLLIGEVRLTQGNTRGAQDAFEEVLARSPGEGRAHYRLGMILAEAGRGEEAIRHMESAVVARPEHFEPHFQLALLYYSERQDLERALAELETALAIEPSEPAANLILSELRFLGGRRGTPA